MLWKHAPRYKAVHHSGWDSTVDSSLASDGHSSPGGMPEYQEIPFPQAPFHQEYGHLSSTTNTLEHVQQENSAPCSSNQVIGCGSGTSDSLPECRGQMQPSASAVSLPNDTLHAPYAYHEVGNCTYVELRQARGGGLANTSAAADYDQERSANLVPFAGNTNQNLSGCH